MGILERVKSTVLSIRKSLKRFPLTILISSLLAFLLIYLIESQLSGDIKETVEKIALVLGLGIPLSLCISLLIEKFNRKNSSYSLLLFVAGGLFLIVYYNFFLDNKSLVAAYRYLATLIFLILAFIYIPRIGKNKDYEYYILDVLQSFAITFIYSAVLYIGISIILVTIDQLFDINIKSELYLYTFFIIVFVFAASLFLSKLPSIEREYKDIRYNKSLTVLLTYIVIPLITIYTLILYLYFAKILLTRQWPRGLVSHLVLWYSTVSVGVIFLLTPILEENKIAKLFKQVFPKIILPVLLMMFLSIYKRVAQYGITENRYFVIVLGLWVLATMLYFSIKKPLKNILIPISLSIIVLVSVYGPLSSFSVSKYSQNKRFEKILLENSMIVDGSIVPNENLSKEDQREISNIISYFDRNHNINEIKSLPGGFSLDDMERVIGFEYRPHFMADFEEYRHFYYSINLEEPINIEEFQYFVNINSWQENELQVGDLILQYNRQENILTISKGDSVLLQQDIIVFVKDIYGRLESDAENRKNLLHPMDMTYDISFLGIEDNIEFRFIFKNISGRVDEDDNINLDSTEFILLIGYR
ncbi:MAG: DUF4153 domain-containing protein [Tissierellia bacterium]|nr:DUF4153 domain-containing protein [Tissierellia bacterium]